MISNGRGVEVVEEIIRSSKDGRTPKQAPLLYALAVCARSNDIRTKNAAYRCLPEVCRIPTHLFQFIKFTASRNDRRPGWGRAQRKAVSEWYNQRKFQNDPLALLRLGTKYKKRHTYSHRDLVRLAHVKPKTNHLRHIIQYLIKGTIDDQSIDTDGMTNEVKKLVFAMEQAKRSSRNHISSLVCLIRSHNLTREHIPTNLLNSDEVWRALVYKMPLTALVRNLGKLSKLGLLQNDSLEERHVIERLLDKDKLKAARVHPLTILSAWNSYKRGESFASQIPMRWNVNQTIAGVLERAFYTSFSQFEGTGKRLLVAIDGSDEMCQPINGTPLVMARSGAVAIALLMSKIEPNVEFVQVADDIVPVLITADGNLESISSNFSQLNGTSVGNNTYQAITWAMQNNKYFDAFVLFTASGIGGNIDPSEAMQQYRCIVPDARLILVAMTSKRPTHPAPDDPNTLSVVGFDTKSYKVVSDFIRGNI